MPLLLTQDDLRPLITDKSLLERGFRAVERAIVDHQQGRAGNVSYSQFGLTGPSGGAICIYCAAPLGAAVVRVFAAPGGPIARNGQLMLLFDAGSGELQAIVSGDDMNQVRTGIAAAVGVRHLAPSRAQALCVLGSGGQARAHLRLIHHALPDLRAVVWSPTPAHRQAFATEMSRELDMEVQAVESAQMAVEGADIVTATGLLRGGQPAYDAAWLKPGALHVSVTRSAPPGLRATVYVPALERPRYLSGQRPGAPPGALPDLAPPPLPPAVPPYDDAPVELADVLTGKHPARATEDETLVWELAAMYCWEGAIASWILEWASQSGAGKHFELTSDAPGLFPSW